MSTGALWTERGEPKLVAITGSRVNAWTRRLKTHKCTTTLVFF